MNAPWMTFYNLQDSGMHSSIIIILCSRWIKKMEDTITFFQLQASDNSGCESWQYTNNEFVQMLFSCRLRAVSGTHVRYLSAVSYLPSNVLSVGNQAYELQTLYLTRQAIGWKTEKLTMCILSSEQMALVSYAVNCSPKPTVGRQKIARQQLLARSIASCRLFTR